MTSTPLRKVIPWTTLGNWFSPFSRCQVLAAAMTSLNTMRGVSKTWGSLLALGGLIGVADA